MGEVIPEKWQRKNPLLTSEGFDTLRAIQQHRAAPKWNFEVGDRVTADDLEKAKRFREQVLSAPAQVGGAPPPWVMAWVEDLKARSTLIEERLSGVSLLSAEWEQILPMTREDLATRLADIVPIDADLERLIAYDTSGTTGHAIDVPTHPEALASAHILAERALLAWGVTPEFRPGMTACVNVCAQQSTYVFATVFSVWEGAGFAKVNLREEEWAARKEGARAFFGDLDPFMITADPVALSEMLRWDLPIRPRAIFSTAVALSPALQQQVAAHYGCPVIDWYSTTETGPIAFSSPKGGMEAAAPDLYIEILDDQGRAVADGEWGEITVTGGRNPYLPLLRYRTGDRGRCEEGRLVELEGRAAVYFEAADGSVVNPVDIARILRLHCPFAQHHFVQHEDRSVTLTLRPVPGLPVDFDLVKRLLRRVFGALDIQVVVDEDLGTEGKVVPYQSEMLR